jgi:hypothetical protein
VNHGFQLNVVLVPAETGRRAAVSPPRSACSCS